MKPSAFDKPAVFEKEWTEKELSNVSEYGYGFWLKYLSTYPTSLPTGLAGDYFMVARMTSNKEINKDSVSIPGDRLLGTWMSNKAFIFGT